MLAGEIQKELRHRAYEEGFRSATSSSFFRTRKATWGNRKGIAESFWGRRKGSTLGTSRFTARVDEGPLQSSPQVSPVFPGSWPRTARRQKALGFLCGPVSWTGYSNKKFTPKLECSPAGGVCKPTGCLTADLSGFPSFTSKDRTPHHCPITHTLLNTILGSTNRYICLC